MSLTLAFLALATTVSFAEPTEAQRVEALILVIQEKNPALRALAAEALGQRGPAAGAALPALKTALRDPSGRVCEKAAEALIRIAPQQLTDLVAALEDKQPRVRVAVLKALQEMATPPEAALAGVLKCLEAKNEAVRVHAVLATARYGKKAVPALRELLNGEDARQQLNAAWALGVIGPGAESCVPRLLDLLARGDVDLRCKAAFALCRIAPQSQVVARALLDAIEYQAFAWEPEFIQETVPDSLEDQGAAAVPFILEAMRSADQGLFLPASGLGFALSGCPFTATVQTAKLGERPPFQQWLWQNPLDRIAIAALPGLQDALKSRDADLRQRALRALEYVVQRSPSDLAGTLPTFEPLLAESESDLLLTAIAALRIVGMKGVNTPRAAAVCLRPVLKHPDPEVKKAAATAIEEMERTYRVTD